MNKKTLSFILAVIGLGFLAMSVMNVSNDRTIWLCLGLSCVTVANICTARIRRSE